MNFSLSRLWIAHQAFAALVLMESWLAYPARAGDWPQILGPARNGNAVGETIRNTLEPPPTILWTHPVGEGYAGPAVVGGAVYLFHRVGPHEVVECLDAGTGKVLWQQRSPTFYAASIDPDAGPRCVPLVHAAHVYVVGTSGFLRCLQAETGEVVWSRSLKEDFGAQDGYFGLGSSPVVADGKLLLNVGGRKSAGIVAFDLESGETLWQATDEGASYSSPTVTSLGGQPVAIFAARLNVVGIESASGKVRFRFPYGRPGATVTAATPLVIDGHLFLSANYGVGAAWVKLEPTSANTVWARDDVLSSQYVTSVFHEGYLYGVHGREDLGSTSLRCVDPVSGEVSWSVDGFGITSPILADGKLILLKTDGEFVLALPDREEFHMLGQAKLFDSLVRALPALSSGRLYARDTRELKCVDLRPERDN